MSKIKTLFEDSAHQTAIYPRTKFTAVSDSNGNTLGDVASLSSVTKASGISTPILYAQPFFIDETRLLYNSYVQSYTATEDCYCFLSTNWSNTLAMYIDGVQITNCVYNSGRPFPPILLKAGKVLTTKESGDTVGSCTFRVFGIKY